MPFRPLESVGSATIRNTALSDWPKIPAVGIFQVKVCWTPVVFTRSAQAMIAPESGAA